MAGQKSGVGPGGADLAQCRATMGSRSGVVIVPPDVAAKGGAASRESRRDRAGRDIEHGRGRFVVESLAVDQRERSALLNR